MNIPAPHQLRVLNEEAELAERHKKLDSFLTSPDAPTVDHEERMRLVRQVQFMRAYLGVLRERIAKF